MARYENRHESSNFQNTLNKIAEESSRNTITEMPIELDLATLENESMIANENVSDTRSEYGVAQKMELMALTNGWNDKNERMSITIGENAASYKWMHEKSASLYKFLHQIFSILLIVFSTGLSAGTFIPATDTENYTFSLTRQIFTYIMTVLSVLQNFFKFETLAEQHFVTASEFGKLYYDIQQQMCMYRRDRKNATTYLADILKRYDNLIVFVLRLYNHVGSPIENWY